MKRFLIIALLLALPITASGERGHRMRNDGSDLAKETRLNCIEPIDCTDDGGNNETEINIANNTVTATHIGPGAVGTSELDLTMTPVAWTGDHDFSGGGIEIENGTVPPACTEGQLFLDTDADTGKRLYACETATFVLQGDGGGTPTLDQVLSPAADASFTLEVDEELTFTPTASGLVPAIVIDLDQPDDADATDVVEALRLDITSESEDGGDSLTGLGIVFENGVFNTVMDAGISIDNEEATASTMTDAIIVTSSGVNNGVVDGVDVSAANITNAINIGSNNIITGAGTVASTELDLLTGKTGTLIDDNDTSAGLTTLTGTTLTLGDGGDFTTLTADAGASDPTITFGSNSVAIANAGTFTVDGNAILDDTWVGSTSVTTLGTVTTGTWSATSLVDAKVDANLTITSGTISASTLTLTQGTAPTPTAEGVIEWETDDDHIIVGDSSGQVEFVPAEDVSSDILMTDDGVVTIQPNAVVLGTDSSGNFMDDVTLGAGIGGSHTPSEGSTATIATASGEADFLASGALTCGASTQGKMQVHTTALQYCDNAGTPLLRYAADSDSAGLITDFSNASDMDAAGDVTIAITDVTSFTKADLETQLSNVDNIAEADGDIYSGDHDFGAAGIEVENGTTPPACTEGQLYVDTDATSGARLMACETATFVTQGVAGSGATNETAGVVHPINSATEDFAVGGVDSTSEFFVDAATGDIVSDGSITFGVTNVAETGVVNLENATEICWEDTEETAEACIQMTASENFVLGAGVVGITVPDNSISDEELDEGASFIWTAAHDFGSATSVEVENSGTVTLATDGEVGVDTTDDQFLFRSGSATHILTPRQTVCKSLEDPVTADDDTLMFIAPEIGDIVETSCFLDAGTATISIEDSSQTLMDAPSCGTSDPVTWDASITSSAFSKGEVIEFDMETSSGVGWIVVCFQYTIDAL